MQNINLRIHMGITEQYQLWLTVYLLEFYKLSGISVVLNTSFNDNGESTVESPDDSINTFLSTQTDILILENFIIYK